MTGKEAIRVVSRLSIAEARTLSRMPDDATLALVAVWRVDEPEAFADLVSYVSGARPASERLPQRWPSKRSAVLDLFLDTWRSMEDACRAVSLPRREVTQLLYQLKRAGHHVERRVGTVGLEWRVRVLAPEQDERIVFSVGP